jgi:hypothetical protein
MKNEGYPMPAYLSRWKAVLSALFGLALLALPAAPSLAQQQTIQQFNAVNGENQRHIGALKDLRQQQILQNRDTQTGIVGCQGSGAPGACLNQLRQQNQPQDLNLRNQGLQERDLHMDNRQNLRQQPFPTILNGTSVRPQP